MIPIYALALSSADLDSLDGAIQRCDRAAANPVFANMAGERSAFLSEAYHEQEAIVGERLDIADRRRALREGMTAIAKGGDTIAKLDLEAQALEDRQRALNDRRMLYGLRTDALDAKRQFYLTHCASGKDL